MPTTEFETPSPGAPAVTTSTTAATSATSDPEIFSEPEVAPEPTRRRRFRTRYLVDWRTQVRSSALSIGVLFALLVLLNMAFRNYVEVVSGGGRDAHLQDMVDGLQWRQAITLALSGCVLAGFVGLRILESHRTYGALINISRELANLEAGRYSVTVTLREQDNLHSLATSINRVAVSLQGRCHDRIRTLKQLATRAELLGADGKTLAADIRTMIGLERQSLR